MDTSRSLKICPTNYEERQGLKQCFFRNAITETFNIKGSDAKALNDGDRAIYELSINRHYKLHQILFGYSSKWRTTLEEEFRQNKVQNKCIIATLHHRIVVHISYYGDKGNVPRNF